MVIRLLCLLFGNAYDLKIKKAEKIAALIGFAYLLTISNAYFIWKGEILIRVAVFVLMCFTCPLLCDAKGFGLAKKDRVFWIGFLCFSILFVLQRCDNLSQVLGRIIYYAPTLILVFWPRRVTYMSYRYFFKIVVFFSIGSSIVSILGAIGLLHYVPYFVLEPRSALHERLNYVYYVYCGFLTIHDAFSAVAIPRACGFLQEPGHFSITLGIIYIIERLQGHKPNIAIILCGILTFSSNFFLMCFVVEFFRVIQKEGILKFMRYVFLVCVALAIVYVCLPRSVKDDINYLFFERNLALVIETMQSSGSLMEALDERTNSTGSLYYNKLISRGKIWFGLNVKDEDLILSDFRGILVYRGLIGLFSTVLTILFCIWHLPKRHKLPLLAAFFLVLLHRSWMLDSPYLYVLGFLASISVSIGRTLKKPRERLIKKNVICKEQIEI